MNTWLHRISHCAEIAHPLLERGYLTIGFSDFARPEFISRHPEFVDGENFDSTYEKEWDGDLWRTRWGLWYFLAEMKEGDRVVIPGFPSQGSFSVFEITDNKALRIEEVAIDGLKTWAGEVVAVTDGLLSSNGRTIDLGFARKVRRVEHDLSRSSFADASLTARMKIRGTTAKISDLHENIERSLNAKRSNQPLNLYTTLLDQHMQATLDTISSQLNPDKFEKLIAWYFRKIGATQVQIPPKNEHGKVGDADVVAIFEPLKTIIYVQAKKHTGETDVWAVNQIKDYRDKESDALNESNEIENRYLRVAWVVSTADGFSKECNAFARQNNVLLLNGKDFVRLLLNAGIEGLDAAF